MSQIKWTPVVIVAVLFGLMLFAACGSSTPNDNAGAVFDAETGSHEAGWLLDHKESAQADQSVCTECHGAELNGGISGVSCTSCHMDGVSSAHPSAWSSPSASHRDYILLYPGNLVACSNASCHGANFAGVSGSGPSCTECHSQAYYDCTSCHGQPPATGKHSFHVKDQNKACVECHQLTSALHDNGVVNLVSSITYSFTSYSCSPSCHGTEKWK